MRLRRKPWAVPALQASPLVIKNPEEYRGAWERFFGRKAPLHIELGTGRGKFITTLARQNPEYNFLGVEIKPEVLVVALERAKEILDQGNIGLLWLNINYILDAFAPGDVDRIYINFCDPWPKKRHAKRRLTHRRFLEMYKQFLKPGGEIHLKTDHEGLFEFSLNELSDSGFRLRNIVFDLHKSGFEGNIMTEYEEKFAERGVRIYRCEAVYPLQEHCLRG